MFSEMYSSPHRENKTAEKPNPIISNYLNLHPDISEREQNFLINYYNKLKGEMIKETAGSHQEEAKRVKKDGLRGKEFLKVWGTKKQNPENGPNATTLFLNEIKNIEEMAAKQTIELFELKQNAEIDDLTGLYRGAAFDQYAEETLRASQKMAMKSNLERPKEKRIISAYVAIDIDNFKTINDTIGHVAADKFILSRMGEILRGTPDTPGIIRSTDLGSRPGGDEFVILFSQIRANALQPTIEKLLKSFDAITYKDKDGYEIHITVSAGVKTIEAEEKITLKEARHLADEAANLAKIEKNTFLIYTPDLSEKIKQMIITDADKPDAENKGLQFFNRQQRQLNKRAIENIMQFNPDDVPEYEKTIVTQARINLKAKLKQLQTKEKSA